VSPAAAELVEQLYEQAWNGRRYALADELFAPGYTSPAAPGLRGGAAKAAIMRGYHGAFPDLRMIVDDVVVGADRVAVRLTVAGTDTGGFRGRPPTGRAVRCWATEFLRVEDGRITEDWVGTDWLGALEQLGVLASPWG
jgi:predicted ester cyclase